MLMLGGITFKDYELPEHIEYGGKHTLATKKLIGGKRVIDALGPDDDDISWSGRFQGEDAAQRAAALDSLRNSGAEVELLFGDQFRMVVVQDVRLTHERPWQILYHVSCMVSSDPARDAVAPDLFSALSGLIGADIGSIADVVAGIAGTQAADALAGALDAIGATDLDSALPGQLVGLTPALADAYAALGAGAGLTGAALDAALDAQTPLQLAAQLTGKAAVLAQHTAYATAATYVGRINTNLVLGAANG